MEEFYSNIIKRIPLKAKIDKALIRYLILTDESLASYFLLEYSSNEYEIYYDLTKSKFIEKGIYSFIYNDKHYILYNKRINNDDTSLVLNKRLDLLIALFDDFKANVKLDKRNNKNLDNLFKVLDRRFAYLELRIREIETKPIKNDFDWIVLANYHHILDARVIIYDLENDMFKMLDKTLDAPLGLVIRKSIVEYKDRSIVLVPDVYYGLIASLFARFYVSYDNYDLKDLMRKKLEQESSFNKKYFLFFVLYIYILDLNISSYQTEINVYLFLEISKRISKAIKDFYDYAK